MVPICPSSLFVVLILNKTDLTSGLLPRFLRLQFGECRANSIKLGAGGFVDIVLVTKNIFNIEFQLFKVLSKLGYISIIFTSIAMSLVSTPDSIAKPCSVKA